MAVTNAEAPPARLQMDNIQDTPRGASLSNCTTSQLAPDVALGRRTTRIAKPRRAWLTGRPTTDRHANTRSGRHSTARRILGKTIIPDDDGHFGVH